MTDLHLDPREGSGDLATPLRQIGVPVKVEQLAFGDAMIIGRGPEERPVLMGIEIKLVPDLLQGFLDHRFTGYQFPGMMEAYEVPVLLIEGAPASNARGELIYWSGARWKKPEGRFWTYDEFQERLTTITMRGGMQVEKTFDRRTTAMWLASTYWWFTKKPWEEHGSHIAMRVKTLEPDPTSNYVATPKMKVAAALVRGVGREKAKAIGEHFRSVLAMAEASPAAWKAVPGIGDKLARDLHAEIRRES